MQETDSKEEKFLRPILGDRIQYFLIGQRPESIDYEIPEIFSSQLLDSMNFMPKSILQIIDPVKWHLVNKNNHIQSHLNFGVIFDDYPIDYYNFLFGIPYKVIVIFLNTQNDQIFQQLEKLDRFFLVSSDSDEIYSKIKSSPNLKTKAFRSQKKLLKKILDFTLHELDITPETFADIQQRRFEQAEKMLQDLNFKEVPNFLAARANTANIYQLLSLDKPELLKVKAVTGQERVKALLDTSLTLGILSQHLKFSNEESLPDKLSLPTIIVSYPFFNPDYRERIKEIIDEAGGDERSIAKQMRYLRFIEQDIKTYDYTVNLESKNSNTDPKMLLYGSKIKQQHTLFLDLVGYLHSTFELSPYIRVPARGASLNTYISRLSPSQYRKTQNSRSLGRNLAQIGKAISSNAPSEVLDFLGRYADGIFAISDLPLEWLLVQDIPLAFLCDVCRVPETGSTSILAQFNINCRQFLRIQKNILRETLVVCGATSEDPIFKSYQRHVNLQKAQDLPYKTAHIESKDEFFETVNKLRPHLLIIDSHGDFKKQSEGSYIWLGNEKLTGKDIVEHLPQIPLVILSCCWGTPIYGNANTIAQAFFEKGSFSVLSTFLPISINKGFILYVRILNNLSYAANHGMHESWMNFISHNIRTSYIDDLLDLVFEKFSLDVLEHDKYMKLRTDWQLKCMNREARSSKYNEAREIIMGCIKDSYKSKVERFLKNSEPIPEFMLYTHLGRGDLIKFDSWIKKNNPS